MLRVPPLLYSRRFPEDDPSGPFDSATLRNLSSTTVRMTSIL